MAHHSSRVHPPLGLCSNFCIFKDIVEGCAVSPGTRHHLIGPEQLTAIGVDNAVSVEF